MKNIKKKGELHPNNPHRGKYDFKILTKALPELKSWVKKSPRGDDTIDFSDSKAVVLLNKALLKTHYGVENWDIPEGFLCPPIPGRADYIHYIAELIGGRRKGVRVLDIGTGANCIYPIIGSQSYGWRFTASDIDPQSVENSRRIVESNEVLRGRVDVRLQKDRNNIFRGIIEDGESYDLTMCNPPFHASLEDAMKANRRKVNNLSKGSKGVKEGLNFGGQKAELWCPGGERLFLKKMVKESRDFAREVKWFTSLVSNKDNVKPTLKLIEKLGGRSRVLEMSQGQKVSRVVAWTFSE